MVIALLLRLNKAEPGGYILSLLIREAVGLYVTVSVNGGDISGGKISWLFADAQENIGDLFGLPYGVQVAEVVGAPYVAAVKVGLRDLHEVLEDVLVALEVFVGEHVCLSCIWLCINVQLYGSVPGNLQVSLSPGICFHALINND